MPVVSTNTVNLQDSKFGLATFNEDLFLSTDINVDDGIYYTKIFKKQDFHIWHRVNWIDNQTTSTFAKVKIEVRIRTGNLLPIKDYSDDSRYTLDELNSSVLTQDREYFDSIFLRCTAGRSCLNSTAFTGSTDTVPTTPASVRKLGTALNTARLSSEDDAMWTYWGLPIFASPSYIANNVNFDYLQARIELQSIDDITVPKMFRINFTSLAKDK